MPFFNKSVRGAREAMLYLARGGRVGMLIDQKMNEGVEARLFRQPVMTTTSPAALRAALPVPMVPGHTIRIGPCRFRGLCRAAGAAARQRRSSRPISPRAPRP